MRAAGRGGVADRRLRRPGGPAVRLAGVVLLLVLAALGCAARGITHLSTTGTLAAGTGSVPFIVGVIAVAAACLVLAGLLVLLSGRRRRRPQDEFAPVLEPVGPWWARVLVLLAALALIALPVAAVVATLRGSARPAGRDAGACRSCRCSPGATSVARARRTAPSCTVAAAALSRPGAWAALVVAGLWLRRRRLGGRGARRTPRHGEVALPVCAVPAGSRRVSTPRSAPRRRRQRGDHRLLRRDGGHAGRCRVGPARPAAAAGVICA